MIATGNRKWRVFLDYLKSINELHDRQVFYSTLTTNCTPSILPNTCMNPESPPLWWEILLSGYVPDYLYGLGRLDTSLPFAPARKSIARERACARCR